MEKMFFITSKTDFDRFFKPRNPATSKASKSTPKASKASKASKKKNVGSEIKYNIMSGEMLKNFFEKKP